MTRLLMALDADHNPANVLDLGGRDVALAQFYLEYSFVTAGAVAAAF